MNTRRALGLDALLLLALLASVVGLLRSADFHGLVSFGLVGGVALHVGVHRRWLVRAARRIGRSGPRTVRDLTVATALGTLFVPLTLTGMSLFSTLDRGDDLHTVTGWLFVSLVAVHVSLHARWVRRAMAARPSRLASAN